MKIGKKVWVIPDGELPLTGRGNLNAHEAVVILNPNERDANIKVNIYFREEDPVENVSLVVRAKRMFDFKVNNPDEFGGFKMPEGKPYSLVLISDLPIVVQHSRLVSFGECFSLFTTISYSQDEL
ncbi:MAG: hypothetical protein H5T85_01750 [Actinobacteria bacterium]|nr:hypothetical protein [Actinomycetota bacterium]